MNNWTVVLSTEFEPEFEALPSSIQDELLAIALVLGQVGPNLGRPYADTLNGSTFANMKELRFQVSNEVWRFAFAFDTERQAVILVGGDKQGVNQKRFYKNLIAIADERFAMHLQRLAEEKKTE